MICKLCADAAEANARRLEAEPDGPGDWYPHPTDCECTCQHRPVGSWKGVKR